MLKRQRMQEHVEGFLCQKTFPEQIQSPFYKHTVMKATNPDEVTFK